MEPTSEEERKAAIQRKALAALQQGGKFGCRNCWAKLKSTAASFGFDSWQVMSD